MHSRRNRLLLLGVGIIVVLLEASVTLPGFVYFLLSVVAVVCITAAIWPVHVHSFLSRLPHGPAMLAYLARKEAEIFGIEDASSDRADLATRPMASLAQPDAVTKPGPQIQIECHHASLPKVVPPEGLVHTMTFYGQGMKAQGLGERQGHPGDAWHWYPDKTVRGIYKCTVTNYAPEPIFHVELIFKVVTREAVKLPDNPPGSVVTGNVTESYDRPFLIPKLDVRRPFDFYLVNQSPDFVTVIFPDSAVFLRAGSSENGEQVKLLPPNMDSAILSPGKIDEGA
jgi:hypothetical protein